MLVLVLVLEVCVRGLIQGTRLFVVVIGKGKGMNYRFDHEKLDVYQLELQFVAWETVLIEEVKETAGPKVREACDHLDRSGLSTLLNTAEGNGKRQGKSRGRFFDDARGSAMACAACLDALVVKNACSQERIGEGKELLHRIVSMLTKLVQRFSGDGEVRETEGEYLLGSEDEDEDE